MVVDAVVRHWLEGLQEAKEERPSITFHDVLHGFRAGRGTGTATLEANMIQQLAAIREEFLDVIFLNLTKAYDALERSM